MSASLAISSTQQRDRSTPVPESRVKPTLRATAAVPLSRRTGGRAAVRPGWEHWGLDLGSEELPPGFGQPGRRVTLAGADHSPGGRRSQPRRTQVAAQEIAGRSPGGHRSPAVSLGAQGGRAGLSAGFGVVVVIWARDLVIPPHQWSPRCLLASCRKPLQL